MHIFKFDLSTQQQSRLKCMIPPEPGFTLYWYTALLPPAAAEVPLDSVRDTVLYCVPQLCSGDESRTSSRGSKQRPGQSSTLLLLSEAAFCADDSSLSVRQSLLSQSGADSSSSLNAERHPEQLLYPTAADSLSLQMCPGLPLIKG